MKTKLFASLLTICGMSFALPAANISWTGAKNNNWSDPANWGDGTAVPTTADVAVFNVSEATTINVDTAAATVGQLKIEAASAAVTFGGSGKLTIAAKGDASVPVSQTNVRICNLNAACWTTFDCDVDFACGGKTVIGGATVFNGDVCVTVGNWFGVCGISGVTPGEGMAKTVFHGAFSFAGSTAGSFYCLDEGAELVVDIADSSKKFATANFGFTINNGNDYSTCGKATFTRGFASITGTLNNGCTKRTVSDRFVIDGGTVYVKEQAYATMTNGFHFISGDYRVGKTSSLATSALFPLLGFYDGVLATGCTTRHVLMANSQAVALFGAADEPSSATLNGQLCVTNNAWITFGASDNPIPDPVLKGSGELVIKGPDMAGRKMTLEGLTLTMAGTLSSMQYDRELWLKDILWRGYGDVTGISGKGSPSIHFGGTCTLDTADAYQPGVTRTFDLTSSSTTICAEEEPTLVVKGGGTVKMNWATAVQQEFAAVTVKAGTTLLTAGAGAAKIGALTLESGANLGIAVANKPTLEIVDSASLAGATLTVIVPSTQTADLYYVVTGGKLPASGYTIVLDNKSSTAYSYSVCDGNLYVHTAAVNPTPGAVEWTGGGDGTSWSDAQNWVVAPVEDDKVYFNGFSNLNVNVNVGSTLTLKQLYFRPSAGGFTLTGAPLVLDNEGNYKTGPLYCEAAMSVTINNDITFTKGGAGIAKYGLSDCLTFGGTVTAVNGLLSLDGAFAFAGTATFKRLSYMNGHANTHLIVENGGTVNLTGNPDLRSGALTVKAGGTLNLTETCTGGWDWLNGGCAVALDGRINVAKGFGASTTSTPKAKFTGAGRLDIGYTTIPAAFGWRGEMVGVTLNVSNRWDTTIAGKEAYAAALTLNKGTLGAKGDFTYGVSSEADAASITTAAADRALVLTGACTIDTTDPDTGVAHTITFTDPINGAAGSLAKKGDGDLVLMADSEAASNDFTGGLTLQAGRVVFNGACTVTAGAVTVAGGGLGLTRSFRRDCRDWTTVLKATSVSETPVDPTGKTLFRLVEQAGYVEIQAKDNFKGLSILVR